MCQPDLSFVSKYLFIVAGSKLTFSKIKYSDIRFYKFLYTQKDMEIYNNIYCNRQDFL